MKDKIFLDTNVLVYVYSETEIAKQNVSRTIVRNCNTIISSQVLQEIANVLQKKFGKSHTEIKNTLIECSEDISFIYTNTYHTVFRACDIAERYGFSFYDSMIVTAALECECKTLYSEDLQHKQIIDGKLTIFNPFL